MISTPDKNANNPTSSWRNCTRQSSFAAKNDTHKITSELVEAYTQCQRKVFLLLQDKIEGREHEYSQILKERATANRLKFETTSEVRLKGIIDSKRSTTPNLAA